MALKTGSDDNSPRAYSVVCCGIVLIRAGLDAMIPYSHESLRELSRDDLIESVLKLAGKVQQLQAEVTALKKPRPLRVAQLVAAAVA